MDVSSRLIEQFVAIVDAGGVTPAAAQLGLSQGTLSEALQRLEDEIGVPLVVRQPFGLTGAGLVLIEQARTVVRSLEAVEVAADRIATGSLGETSITCPPGMGVWPLPLLLRDLLTLAPTARVSIVSTATAAEAVQEVRAARAELALVPRIDPPDDLVAVPAGRHRLDLVQPKGWPAHDGDASLERLGEFPFIEGGPNSSAAVALVELKRGGARPRSVVRNAPLAAALQLVVQGVGASFLTPPLAELAVATGCTVVHGISTPQHDVHLVRRHGDVSPLARMLFGLVLGGATAVTADAYPTPSIGRPSDR